MLPQLAANCKPSIKSAFFNLITASVPPVAPGDIATATSKPAISLLVYAKLVVPVTPSAR